MLKQMLMQTLQQPILKTKGKLPETNMIGPARVNWSASREYGVKVEGEITLGMDQMKKLVAVWKFGPKVEGIEMRGPGYFVVKIPVLEKILDICEKNVRSYHVKGGSTMHARLSQFL
eukprot:TRINITY_DN8088_c0_g1_i5.p2 TRINITY_DN8088_c0_g1~~TRINITY_DN8088_c0_g1_i5.p2  ORF type:complete len:117 (-),score=21.13 TRINITY_DN8088_c0_g1_i5:83-433(-)